MLCGCFSVSEVGPIFCIKEKYYVKILEKVMLPYVDREMALNKKFIQNNDPIHA